jgi:hypothetical protein
MLRRSPDKHFARFGGLQLTNDLFSGGPLNSIPMPQRHAESSHAGVHRPIGRVTSAITQVSHSIVLGSGMVSFLALSRPIQGGRSQYPWTFTATVPSEVSTSRLDGVPALTGTDRPNRHSSSAAIAASISHTSTAPIAHSGT